MTLEADPCAFLGDMPNFVALSTFNVIVFVGLDLVAAVDFDVEFLADVSDAVDFVIFGLELDGAW